MKKIAFRKLLAVLALCMASLWISVPAMAAGEDETTAAQTEQLENLGESQETEQPEEPEDSEELEQPITAEQFTLSKLQLSGYTGQTFTLSVISELDTEHYSVQWVLDSHFTAVSANLNENEIQFTSTAPGGNMIALIYDTTGEEPELVTAYGCVVSVRNRTGKWSIKNTTLLSKEKIDFSLTVTPKKRVASVVYTTKDSKIATVSGNGTTGTIQGVGAGTTQIQAEIHFTDTTDVLCITTNVTVEKPAFSAAGYACAKGASVTVSANNYTKSTVVWSVDNTSIATVNAKTGKVTGVKTGTVKVTATFTSPQGATYAISKNVAITNPKFANTKYTIAKSKTVELKFSGTDAYSVAKNWKSSDTSVATVSNGVVTAKKKGTVTITAEVDGKQIYCKIIVSAPTFSKTTYVLTKGKTATVKVSGLKSTSKVTYTVKNKKIATVSAKGKIKAVAYGSTVVTVNVDGLEQEIIVAVGKAKAVKAVNRGYSVLGTPYSQTYRMSKNYYDCSSFVWRCYKTVGITMGVSGTWAPTAAAEALYYKQKGKVIAYKNVSESKLRVGDLMFFDADSTPNGRYLGIDHVAMYVGNGKVIHANGSTMSVAETSYDYIRDDIVLIVRPVQ
jgi:cell wall-associated NlpC family hydrolase